MAVTKKKITAVKISTDPNTQYDIDLPSDATPSISQLTVSEVFAKSLYASDSVSFSGSVYSSVYGFKSGSAGTSTDYLDGSIKYTHSIEGRNCSYTFPTDKSGTFALTSDISALNIEGGSGATAVQMLQDGTSGTFDFTGKNPNATALDSSLTGNIAYGGTGAYSASFCGKSAAMGKRSFAQGTTTIAKGAYSHAEGDNSVALGNDSHAEGAVNVAAGFASHAEGNTTQATGDNSHSEGNLTVSSALNSHAEGYKTSAVGQSSHAEGSESIAGSTASHAEGNTTIASGVHTHSEGYLTRAYGDNSHAEGYLTIAHGTNSHVEGYSSMVLTSVPSSGESGSGGTSSGTTQKGETPYGQNCHAEG